MQVQTRPNRGNGTSPIPMPLRTSVSLLSGCPAAADIAEVDAAWASKALFAWHYPYQRKLIPDNVERLGKEMRAGRFVPATPVFICRTPDGAMYLVNGYHTLTAIKDTGARIWLTAIVLDVADMAAVGRVYATFDIHRARSYAASLKAYLSRDVSHFESKALSGMPFILADFRTKHVRGTLSREERMELLKEYAIAGTVTLLENVVAECELSQKITRAGIMAIMLYTCLHQPSMATEFWHLCVTEEHPDTNHPSRAFGRYLRRDHPAGSRGQEEDMVHAALAWNANFEGRTAAFFKPSTGIFRLSGTPLAKGRKE